MGTKEELAALRKKYGTGTDALRLIYGDLKQGCKVVRLHRAYKKPFDRIRIGEKTYRVDLSRRNKAFYISEVQ